MKEAHVVPAIYLLAVVVLGFAATLLRLPPLVGFLAAGFVLGASDLPNLDFVQTLGDLGVAVLLTRSEERRVGKECRSRWSPYH